MLDALLDTKSTHSLYAHSHCSVPVCPARTTAVRYALLLIQPLYTTTARNTKRLISAKLRKNGGLWTVRIKSEKSSA